MDKLISWQSSFYVFQVSAILCVLWWIIASDDMTSPNTMYLININGCPRDLHLFWCKPCADMSIELKLLKNNYKNLVELCHLCVCLVGDYCLG